MITLLLLDQSLFCFPLLRILSLAFILVFPPSLTSTPQIVADGVEQEDNIEANNIATAEQCKAFIFNRLLLN